MKATYQGKEWNVAKSGGGYTLSSLIDPNTNVLLTEDEYSKTGLPPFQAAMSMEFASKAFGKVTLASEFGDELYPVQAGEIKAGDQVYVKPIHKFGSVIRTIGEKYLVEANLGDKAVISPYFLVELEKRNKE